MFLCEGIIRATKTRVARMNIRKISSRRGVYVARKNLYNTYAAVLLTGDHTSEKMEELIG